MTKREKIEELVAEELESANKKYPLFHSPHEAYAVLAEEVEEVEYDIEKVKQRLRYMWLAVKNDDNIENHATMLYAYAVNAIGELIQCAAMCDKIKQSGLYKEKE